MSRVSFTNLWPPWNISCRLRYLKLLILLGCVVSVSRYLLVFSLFFLRLSYFSHCISLPLRCSPTNSRIMWLSYLASSSVYVIVCCTTRLKTNEYTMISIMTTKGTESGTEWHTNRLSNRGFLGNCFLPFCWLHNYKHSAYFVGSFSPQISCTD